MRPLFVKKDAQHLTESESEGDFDDNQDSIYKSPHLPNESVPLKDISFDSTTISAEIEMKTKIFN